MNIDVYNKKREELTALLGDLLSELQLIDNEYAYLNFSELDSARSEIENISHRVYENIFKIMLVARFQGGKSTSFNAMLGGSCYSPMGNAAIKCSAAAITVQHVLDPQKVGATIIMRSKDELQALLGEIGLDFDISDSDGIEDARSAWLARFTKWKEDPRIYNEKERDFLFICGLILQHFDNPKVRELLDKKEFVAGLEDVGKYAKFPDDYLIRYSRDGASAFHLEDVLFAFVHRIDCRTQSERLSRIGALVEDCPGLFANSFDTTVTFQEMADANAVWYLFNARAPEESDIRAIKACMEICKDRIFYSANIKDNQVAKPIFIDKIFPVIKEQIKNLTGENVEVYPYHALGALLYMQGSEYLRNERKFENASVANYLISTCKDRGFESSDPAECWRALARVTIMGMYPMGHPSFTSIPDPLSEAGLSILRKESHWDEITGAIQNYVISTKAKSILVTDSAEKAVELVDNLSKLLKTREEAAIQNETIVKSKFEDARNKLKDFENYAERRMASLSGDGSKYIDATLAKDLFEKAFIDTVNEVAQEAAPGILDESSLFSIGISKVAQVSKNCWRWIKSQYYNVKFDRAESSFVVSCRNTIQNAIQKSASGKITGWVKSVVEGRNVEFCKLVAEPASAICWELKAEWNHVCSGNDTLRGIEPVFPEPPKVWTISCQLDKTGKAAAGAGTMFAIKEFLSDLMVCGSGSLIFVALCCEPVTLVITAVVMLLKKLFTDREEQLREIQCTIKEKLIEGYRQSQFEMVKHFARQLSPLREQVVNRVYAPVQEIKNQFNAAQNAALDDLKKGEAERQKIAADCNEIRTRLLADGKTYKLLLNYISETAPLC